MQPIVDQTFRLEKFHGKGGWTFAVIPGVTKDKRNPFGWKRVKGSIDGYEIKGYHLMPMGNGNLFLPVKAEIRKKIRKQDGDLVHIILYPDKDPIEVPPEFLECLQDEPRALKFFESLSESEKKYYIQWVASAKRIETKADRMAKSVNRLARGLKLYEKEY